MKNTNARIPIRKFYLKIIGFFMKFQGSVGGKYINYPEIMMMGVTNYFVKVRFVISIDNGIFYLHLKVVKYFPSPECSFEFTTTQYIQN